MKNIVLILSLSFFFAFNASSQEEKINVEAIDNYKYVIVPLKFELLKDVDKYQINSLTKFLFNKYGYTAFLENDPFPEDLRQNRCLALKTDLVKVKGGFLSTRLQINLMDCNGVLVASSKIGKTREKEFKVAYNLAVRDAFQTFQFYEYNYKPDSKITALPTNDNAGTTKQNEEETIVAQEEIERLKQEVAALKEEKVVKQAVIVPVVSTSPKKETIETPQELTEDAKILYAQPIDKGYQVVDKTPKVIMILLETPKENTFIVKDQNAIVYKEHGFWYLSKNDGNAISLETLNIKF